jgi:hypothetical protein
VLASDWRVASGVGTFCAASLPLLTLRLSSCIWDILGLFSAFDRPPWFGRGCETTVASGKVFGGRKVTISDDANELLLFVL